MNTTVSVSVTATVEDILPAYLYEGDIVLVPADGGVMRVAARKVYDCRFAPGTGLESVQVTFADGLVLTVPRDQEVSVVRVR